MRIETMRIESSSGSRDFYCVSGEINDEFAHFTLRENGQWCSNPNHGDGGRHQAGSFATCSPTPAGLALQIADDADQVALLRIAALPEHADEAFGLPAGCITQLFEADPALM
jgi:hypothetical protein